MRCQYSKDPMYFHIVTMELYGAGQAMNRQSEMVDGEALSGDDRATLSSDGTVYAEESWFPRAAPGLYSIRFDLVQLPCESETGALPKKHFLGAGSIEIYQ
jgi:hypothetical protein